MEIKCITARWAGNDGLGTEDRSKMVILHIGDKFAGTKRTMVLSNIEKIGCRLYWKRDFLAGLLIIRDHINLDRVKKLILLSSV